MRILEHISILLFLLIHVETQTFNPIYSYMYPLRNSNETFKGYCIENFLTNQNKVKKKLLNIKN